jgi:hypothetical protein
MTDLRIVGQSTAEDDWLHRFRNLGEEIYVELRDFHAVSMEEIDASFDAFHVRAVPPEQVTAVLNTLSDMIRQHHLDDSVVAVRAPFPGFRTVVLVLDAAFGERLWTIAYHDTWIVPSDSNRAVVEKLWESTRGEPDRPTITICSAPPPATTEEDWLATLGLIEMHHDLPGTLSVYGAKVTPAVEAGLRAYGYDDVRPTGFGFLAFQRRTA